MLRRYRLLILLLALPVGACSILSSDQDGPGERIGAGTVADATPRPEPKSKYGNPASYVVNGKRYYVKNSSAGYTARGTASWYGKKFHGRRTSSGEIFNMYRATAAHTTLPLPTYAKVTNLDNGKAVVVKINDRGPFHSERIIDLSYGAAVKIGLDKQGTGRVEVRVIETGPGRTAVATATPAVVAEPLVSNGTYIQVGAFKQFVNAQEMRARTNGAGLFGVTVNKGTTSTGENIYKVRVGPYENTARIDAAIDKLRAAGIEDYKLITQ